jgi:hypothetical protein
MESASTRPWQVLLLGGASGTGKTRLSYRLAWALDIGITEVDDFQVVLERMTTPKHSLHCTSGGLIPTRAHCPQRRSTNRAWRSYR